MSIKALSDLTTKLRDNPQWPLDCAMGRIDEFDEIVVLAKKRGGGGSVCRFTSGMRSSFWWIGALEAMKDIILRESVTDREEE